MELLATLRGEQLLLRGELQELKRCQLQYFLATVAGSGLLFGLAEVFPDKTDARSVSFLAPLVILLPCWLTFFDKATTITRIVGYMRIIELELCRETPAYLGYENALMLFREKERSHPPETRQRLRHLGKWPSYVWLLALRTRHRYWMINWWTFFVLGSICCILVPLSEPQWTLRVWVPLAVAASSVLLVALYTFRVVANLVRGSYSYRNVFEFWCKHLGPELERLRSRTGGPEPGVSSVFAPSTVPSPGRSAS
jgi:hypothetical protein